jgi:DNA replication licensing factor MCM3
LTPRALDSLFRLATAHAKARLGKRVTIKDAKIAEEIVRFALFKEVSIGDRRKRRKTNVNDNDEIDSDDDTNDDSDKDETRYSILFRHEIFIAKILLISRFFL